MIQYPEDGPSSWRISRILAEEFSVAEDGSASRENIILKTLN